MKADTKKSNEIHEYHLKLEMINSIYLENTIIKLKNKPKTVNVIKDIKYLPNTSDINIPSAELTDIDHPGVYFMVLGKNMLYDTESIPNNSLVIKLGHAKESGFERTREHKTKGGQKRLSVQPDQGKSRHIMIIV